MIICRLFARFGMVLGGLGVVVAPISSPGGCLGALGAAPGRVGNFM